MKIDIEKFCTSCDVCQKTKPSNFNKYRYLMPNPIPHHLYDSISMDFIVNLPWLGEYNTIFVVVDHLSKHANFIPTTTGLNAEEFGALFIKEIMCRFGLPSSIIMDRDPRWSSDFWKGVVKLLKTRMLLSSSHHPQHDGQTEVVNKGIGMMLRAYIAADKEGWAEWLPLLEFAYNSNNHSLIGCSPLFLMYGLNPKTPWDFLTEHKASGIDYHLDLQPEASAFVKALEMHQESAQLAIACAQEGQARSYNKGQRPVPEFKKGDLALVNPHSLEWSKSKGEGVKLTQRWIGPFEVIQKINPKVYQLWMSDKYPGLPIFNINHLK
jgi:hypothetical protein